jgi:hypothetical protein
MAIHPSRTTLKRALFAAVLQAFLVATCLKVDSAFAFHVFPITKLHRKGILSSSWSSRGILQQRAATFQEDEKDKEEPVFQQTSPVLQEKSRVLRRASFFSSWWSQVILTSVSGVILGVILGFARRMAVTARSSAWYIVKCR